MEAVVGNDGEPSDVGPGVVAAGVGATVAARDGSGDDVDVGVRTGVGGAAGPGVGTTVGPGVGTGVGPGVGTGVETTVGSGAGAGVGTTVGPGVTHPHSAVA